MAIHQRPFNHVIVIRIAAILVGAVALVAGWEAYSHGRLWYSTYNARTGTEATGTTLSWIVMGGLFILAGIFPWKWFANRDKR